MELSEHLHEKILELVVVASGKLFIPVELDTASVEPTCPYSYAS